MLTLPIDSTKPKLETNKNLTGEQDEERFAESDGGYFPAL